MGILPFSKKTRMATPYTGKGTLYEKISKSYIFVVYGSMRYYHSLMMGSENIPLHIQIAKELNKPVILLMDKALTERMKIDIERHFTGMNIIKEAVFDFSDPAARIKTTVEIESIAFAMEKEELNELMAVNFRWQ